MPDPRPSLRPFALAAAVASGAWIPLACSPPPSSPVRAAAPLASPAPPPSAAPVACAVDGTVKDGAGRPIANALVAAIASGTMTAAAIARTQKDGAFCLQGLAPSEVGLTVTSLDATSAYVDVFPTSGARAHGVDVRLGGEGFVLRGRVIEASGPAGTRTRTVRLSRLSTFAADTFVVETDAAGSYAVRLPPGAYHADVLHDDVMGMRDDLQLDRDLVADIPTERINPKDRPPPEAVTAWIKERAIPLTTVEAGHGFTDLEPLQSAVGPARAVALGEATHGAREFFQMKHRLLEFLVERMGFRAFAIEASFPDALPLDQYVLTGKGDPYDGVAGMGFWTWNTEEVVELARWMRRYNEDPAHKEKLRFFGFDMQNPTGSVAAVASALALVDRKLWAEVEKDLEPIDDDWSWGRLDEQAQAKDPAAAASLAVLEAAAGKLVARFDEKRDADVKKLGAERWALARIHAHVVADFVAMVKKRTTDHGVRDRAMAANVVRLLEMLGPASKVVLWAHNGHIQRRPSGHTSMGSELAQSLGKDYHALGFAFDQGAFQAIDMGPQHLGLTSFDVAAAPPGSLDGALARASLPLFALDLRQAAGAAKTWLDTPTTYRTVGSMYNAATPDAFFDMAPPANLYDTLVFVAKTTAARAAPSEKRPPRKGPSPTPGALKNGTFEDGEKGQTPTGWSLQGYPRSLKYTATLTDRTPSSGKLSVVLTREPSPLASGRGSLAQTVDARPLRGKRVRIAVQAKLEGKAPGDEAFLYVRAGGGTPTSVSPSIPASKAWKETALELDIAEDADVLIAGLIVTGEVKLSADDFTITPVPGAR